MVYSCTHVTTVGVKGLTAVMNGCYLVTRKSMRVFDMSDTLLLLVTSTDDKSSMLSIVRLSTRGNGAAGHLTLVLTVIGQGPTVS